MDKVINSICILGGGTSGWLTASHLTYNLPPQVKITLIESTSIGTIGVGEGTQPFTTAFLYECGLKPEDWMRGCDSTYKLGVELEGWADVPVFVDNDTSDTAVLGNGVMMHDYILGTKKTKQEFVDWIPSYQLARNNKSPKLDDPRLDFTYGLNGQSWDAVQFRADKITETLKAACKHKLDYYDDEVVKVNSDSTGVTGLETKNNGTLKADLYIDCTGFRSILANAVEADWDDSYKQRLFVDTAIAVQLPYIDKNIQMRNTTYCHALGYGWSWNVPLQNRIGTGYVFSSRHTTVEQATEEFKEHLHSTYGYEKEDLTFRTVPFNVGLRRETWKNNVVAIGLSSFFLEPIESTAIAHLQHQADTVLDMLSSSHIPMHKKRQRFNYLNNLSLDAIASYIEMHYIFSNRRDTQFWRDFSSLDLTPMQKDILKSYATKKQKFNVSNI